MAARVTFFVIAIALLRICTISADAAEEVKGKLKFSYAGNTGPDLWGSMDTSFAMCTTGKSQSPIDIVKDKAVLNKNLKPLRREYHPVNATLVNKGYGIEMQFGDAGVMILDGKNYTLKQMHWHAPAEHRIDGILHDAELHLVHQASDDSLTVVAILYKIGDEDSILAKVESKLAELAKENCASDEVAQVDVGNFDVWRLRRNTRKYYRYVGSLTTPPCAENVIFHIFPTVRPISKEQVKALKAPLLSTCKNNNRPVQPLNGRKVELFDELN